jgi:hypothetical protein
MHHRTFLLSLLSNFEKFPAFPTTFQHFFPYMDVQAPSTIIDAFAQIAEQVAADHTSIGIHVWDLGKALDRQLTIDRVHPTVLGHIALTEALTGLLRPLVTGANDTIT